MSAKFKEGDQVIATIGRKDLPNRERHPGVVRFAVPAEQLGTTKTKDAKGVVTETPNPQSYHVFLTDLKTSFSIEEEDLELASAPEPTAAAHGA